MTALVAFVLGRLLNVDVINYAPYILSGIIYWEFIASTATSGSMAFIQNEPYIKQFRHPLAIYTLRTACANALVLVWANIALFGWVLAFRPQAFDWSWIAWPLSVVLIFAVVWPFTTILAYLTVRFRDIPHGLGLILQAVWFISPVYFEATFFRKAGLHVLVDYNPVYHLFQLVRAPLLSGEWPTLENYLFSLALIVVLSACAIAVGRRGERKVIFYL